MAKKQPTAKVIVAVPCSDAEAMKALTAQSIGGAIIGADGMVIDMVIRRSADIVSNRTWLVNYALKAGEEHGATHILFVDCDMQFASDVIPKMLAHDQKIVGVEYNRREFPLKPTYKPFEETEEKPKELYRARYAGTGLMLIDLSIFKDPKFGIGQDGKRNPWFNFGRDSQGALAMGEDVWFCNVANDAGYHTYIDPTITVKHIGEYAY